MSTRRIALLASVVGLCLLGVIITVASAMTARGPKLTTASASQLTSQDVHGSVRLTRDEREAAVARCTSKVARIDMRGRGTVKISGSVREAREQIDAVAGKICDCMVNQVEDRSSRLQFMMAMSVIDEGNVIGLYQSGPTMNRFWPAAQKLGVSSSDFALKVKSTQNILVESAETCMKHLTGQ